MMAALEESAVIRQGTASGIRVLCLLPSIPLGGMERASVRVVSELMRQGAEAHFVVEDRWGGEVRAHIESAGAEWTGVPFVTGLGMPKTLLGLRVAFRSLLLSARDFRRVFEQYRPQQILATNLDSAYFARHLARRPDPHSVFRLPNPPGLSRYPVKRRIDRAIWRSVYRSFDVLVCNSHYTARRLAEFVGDDARIRVVSNFLNALPAECPGDAPALDPARFTIVYLGQISEAKGVDILVEAVRRLLPDHPQLDLVLAGRGVWRSNFAERTAAGVARDGLEGRIRFLGHVADVQGLLRQADLHVCPSISKAESFPNVVLDAKQAGLASVVFPTAGLPEAVTDGVDGLIAERLDATALAAAIARLITNDTLRQTLADGARRSLARYDADRIVGEWIAILKEPM